MKGSGGGGGRERKAAAAAGGGGQFVLAIEDWHSAVKTDLSFRQGDVIAVQAKAGAWWHGTLAGWSGDIPETYVLGFLDRIEHVSAVRAFTGARSDGTAAVPELSFEPGERLTVKAKGSGEWWYGTLAIADPPRPRTGLFPAEYVAADRREPHSAQRRGVAAAAGGGGRDWWELPAGRAERWAAAVQWSVESALDGPEEAGLSATRDPAGQVAPSFFDMLGVTDSGELSAGGADHDLLRDNFRSTSRRLH